jgi:SAM-dependent methyltransferase
MRIADPAATEVNTDRALCRELLPLAGARVLELGCGRAETTRALAEAFPTARITAMEVDRVQHAKNLAVRDLPNVTFVEGGAQAIPAPDASFDVAIMLKSLHHVPLVEMDGALAEIRRVLVPGGLAYVSEPVYAGDYNDIIRLFHDERSVREAAFAALQRCVEGGVLELVAERFFLAPLRFESWEHFDERMLQSTHTTHVLSPATLAQVRERFMRHVGPQGAKFLTPARVDLLRRPGGGQAAPGAGTPH